MTKNNRAFTLIELLVVVLIIGILAAVALPQYQKAVLKSRFSSLMPTATSIRDGQEMYYMTNGRYADAVSKLDVTATNNGDMTLTVSDDSEYAYTMATRPNMKNNLIMYQKHSVNYPGQIHCEALATNTLANWLCHEGLKGAPIDGNITNNYNTYILEGNANDGKMLTSIEKTAKQVCNDNDCVINNTTHTVTKCNLSYATLEDGTCKALESRDVWNPQNAYQTIYDENGNLSSTVVCGIYSNGICTRSFTRQYNDDGIKAFERACYNGVENGGLCKGGLPSIVWEYALNAQGTQVASFLGVCSGDKVSTSSTCLSYN